MNKYNVEGLDDYEIDAWIGQLGSVPKKKIASADYSESYEMDQAHVLSLESGKYAVVWELGCSCYEAANASIDLFPTRTAAMKAFNEWVKSQDNRGVTRN